MVTFIFSAYARKRFQKLPKSTQQRIKTKLRQLKKHPDIYSVMKSLHHLEPATHRLRIGHYRLILQLLSDRNGNIEYMVLDVGHRKNIYK